MIAPVDSLPLASLPTCPTLQDIQQLEAAMKLQPGQIELVTIHHFADGVYGREIHIPAGARLVGKMHKTAHINIVSRGCIRVWTDQGEKIIRAPATFVAPPGVKRVGEAIEDTVWTTLHPNPTGSQDLDELEQFLIIPENNLTGGVPCHGLQ